MTHSGKRIAKISPGGSFQHSGKRISMRFFAPLRQHGCWACRNNDICKSLHLYRYQIFSCRISVHSADILWHINHSLLQQMCQCRTKCEKN